MNFTATAPAASMSKEPADPEPEPAAKTPAKLNYPKRRRKTARKWAIALLFGAAFALTGCLAIVCRLLAA